MLPQNKVYKSKYIDKQGLFINFTDEIYWQFILTLLYLCQTISKLSDNLLANGYGQKALPDEYFYEIFWP